MYLSELKLWNFRKYGVIGEGGVNAVAPGLHVNFKPGVNVLIGENDGGKTTIIDAIRYALRTQSGEYIQFDEKDFHQTSMGHRTEEFKIECVFDGLSEKDQGLFWEWLSIIKEEETRYQLVVSLYVKRKDNAIIPMFSVGPDASSSMDAEARDLLRVVYLKPLRDALTDMTHGYKSRLSQILGAHQTLHRKKNEDGKDEKHKLEKFYNELKKSIDGYFKDGEEGAGITAGINAFLKNHFLVNGDPRSASIQLTGSELTDILRQLDLVLEGNKSGLGTLNLLCIAAEMLLFSKQQKGLKLALVEELEAHLHPQYQLRLINYISENKDEQFILSTHSVTLASKISLDNLIIVKDNTVYPMSHDYTRMTPADYGFLERFLDATKANLFFAQGLILVEGDAENLLIPVIAEIIGKPLQKFGVSVVNVGSTAYKRYLSIFDRKDDKVFNMPVAVISDLDIRALEYYTEDKKLPILWKTSEILPALKAITDKVDYDAFPEFITSPTYLEAVVRNNWDEPNFPKPKVDTLKAMRAVLTDENAADYNEDVLNKQRIQKEKELHSAIDKNHTKIFLPKAWTLEYEIARSGLYRLLDLAIKLAQYEENHPWEKLEEKTINGIWKEILDVYKDGHELTLQESYDIFKPLNEKIVSKAITAQYFSSLIKGEMAPVKGNDDLLSEIKECILTDINLKYIVDAINHVTN